MDIWKFFSGFAVTDAPGTNERAGRQPEEDTWVFSNGREAKAVPGTNGHASLHLGLVTWSCLSGLAIMAAHGRNRVYLVVVKPHSSLVASSCKVLGFLHGVRTDL